MMRNVWSMAYLVAVLAPFSASAPAEDKKEKAENRNTLITRHKANLKLSASSMWNGWPVEKLIDGDPATSWFSEQGDTSTQCKIPWVEIEFPEDVTIARVTLLGNREPNWPTGFAVVLGKLELFDKDGKRLHEVKDEGVGEHNDFDFTLKQAVKGVRKVRFTSLKDQGDKNEFKDIAIGEIQIE